MKKTTLPLTLLLTLTLVACAQRAPSPTAPTQAPTTQQAKAEPAGPSADDVRAQLAARRQVMIDRLRAYRDHGVFPLNREQPGKLNIFIDDDGNICAAANLMWLDGQEDLVRETAIANNYLRLATVKDGPLMDWMLTSGLTQAEIDRIQEPYMMIEPEPVDDTPQIAAEVERLQAHFDVVLAELEKNADASLTAATALLLAKPSLVASL